MTLHLARFAAGHASIESLRLQQIEDAKAFTSEGAPDAVPLYMRNRRRRASEFTRESSLYWVIEGAFACRQRILGFEDGLDQDGRRFTTMLLDPELVPIDPVPRRNFGGWRYLEEGEVPDGRSQGPEEGAEMPESLRRELRSLGLF